MEFGSKNRFEAGQPINTDDAMNDMPKNANDVFAQRVQERVADGTYTQEKADKLLEKARALSEENARNQAETDAYNAWANMTPADFEARENKVEEEYDPVSTFQIYPRMQGETSAEYGKRLSEIKAAENQYLEEHPEPTVEKAAMSAYRDMVNRRVESGDLKSDDAEAMIQRREEQYAEMEAEKQAEVENAKVADSFAERQEQEKMAMAERIRKEVPEALEFLEKHPELKPEMVAAVRKLEELEKISEINEQTDQKLNEEMVRRNETFMKAVEAFNAAARANEAARAKMAGLEADARNGKTVSEEEFKAVEDEIHATEVNMQEANAAKQGAEDNYNAVEAATRAAAEKQTADINKRINFYDRAVAEEQEYYNVNVSSLREKMAETEAANEVARAKMAGLEADARNGKTVSEEEFKAVEDEIHATEDMMSKIQKSLDFYKGDQKESGEKLDEWVDYKRATDKDQEFIDKLEAAEAEKAGKNTENVAEKDGDGDGDEDIEIVAGKDDPEIVAGKDDPEIVAGKDEDGEKTSEEEELETAAKKGLFNKMRNFLGLNEQAGNGIMSALRHSKIAKAIFVTALSAVILNSLGGFFSKHLEDKSKDLAQNQVKVEQGTNQKMPDLNELARRSLNVVDDSAERKEVLDDLVNTKAYGHDIEVNINEGDWSGTSSFFDANKHGKFDLVSPVTDLEALKDMKNHEKAEAIAEGLSQKIDDPTLMTEIAAAMGNVEIGGKGKNIQSLSDWNDILRSAQDDDVFHNKLLKSIKEGEDGWRDMVSKNDLKLNHVNKGAIYISPYAVNIAEQGENPNLMMFVHQEVTATEDLDCLDFVDKNTGKSILDANKIGGYKYNYLKACNLIPENATDEAAQKIMAKYKVLGFSQVCSQLLIEHVKTDGGGDKTKTSAGNEGETTTSAGNEGETTTSVGNEGETITPSAVEGETTTPSAVEGETTTPSAVEGETITPSAVEVDNNIVPGSVGNEGETTFKVVPKTEERVANEYWDKASVTDYDQSTRGEVVDTAKSTKTSVNQEITGSSSNTAQDDFLKGGIQSTGNAATDAKYDGSNTEGWRGNTPSTEAGAQNIQEPTTPVEVNAINDSAANQGSATANTENRTDQQNADVFNDILNGN